MFSYCEAKNIHKEKIYIMESRYYQCFPDPLLFLVVVYVLMTRYWYRYFKSDQM